MAVPVTFPAFVVERSGERTDRSVRSFRLADLPAGEVTVRVAWSSVNYKDALATVREGGVARISPLVPGIDLAGVVATSTDPGIAPGQAVIVHGYELGQSHHGGFAHYARVPAAWVVPLPGGLTLRSAMAIGTAGFTAAMAVDALERGGLRPGDGPVLVTGASGGLGSLAVAILAARGHEAWAATGRPGERARLRRLGAARIVDRSEIIVPDPPPLGHARWAGAIDSVGGPTLPGVLSGLRPGATLAACGNAGGSRFTTTVFPFILRGVAMLGMDSAHLAIESRRALWRRLADPADLRPPDPEADVREVDLAGLAEALDAVLAGRLAGRTVVRLSDDLPGPGTASRP